MSDETLWTEREAGQIAAPLTDDPTVVLVARGAPSWVKTPPELGEQRFRVAEAWQQMCVLEGCERVGQHLSLIGSPYRVCECVDHGFTWYSLTNLYSDQSAE